MVLVGAEGVAESGGIINKVGRFSSVQSVGCQIELSGWWMGGWMFGRVIRSNSLFVKRYLGRYSRSEVETLRVGRVWWEVDAHP